MEIIRRHRTCRALSPKVLPAFPEQFSPGSELVSVHICFDAGGAEVRGIQTGLSNASVALLKWAASLRTYVSGWNHHKGGNAIVFFAVGCHCGVDYWAEVDLIPRFRVGTDV